MRHQDEQKWDVLDVSHVEKPNLKLRCVHSRTPKAKESKSRSGTQIQTQVEIQPHIYWGGRASNYTGWLDQFFGAIHK